MLKRPVVGGKSPCSFASRIFNLISFFSLSRLFISSCKENFFSASEAFASSPRKKLSFLIMMFNCSFKPSSSDAMTKCWFLLRYPTLLCFQACSSPAWTGNSMPDIIPAPENRTKSPVPQACINRKGKKAALPAQDKPDRKGKQKDHG